MKKNITVIPGDGIGPEVIYQAVRVLKAIGRRYNHQFKFSYELMGACSIDKTGNSLPDQTIESCLKSDAVLLGAIGHPKYNEPSGKVRPEQAFIELRKSLQLFVSIRPVSTYKSLYHLSPLKERRLKGVDFIIFHELTDGIYNGIEHLDGECDGAPDLSKCHKSRIDFVARLAFETAQKRKSHLTLVDKANDLETSRLWRKTIHKLSSGYPEVKVDYMLVDNAAMQLILNPAQFDVILTENMFGDILNDEASVLTGSKSLLPSSFIGDRNALFHPIHESCAQSAGLDIANPVGAILSVALMMDYFELYEEAEKIRQAVNWTLSNGFVTKDIDAMNSYCMSTVSELICEFISDDIPHSFNLNNISFGQMTII